MRAFRDLSIKRKLIVLTTLISMAVVVLASAAYLVHDLITFRQALADDLKGLARIIGTNSTAALTFQDQRTAGETLAALSIRSHVVAASIFTKDGTTLARFVRKDAGQAAVTTYPASFEPTFIDEYLFVSQPVLLDGEPIGSVALQYDLIELGDRMKNYRSIALVILFVATLAAMSLTAVLQRLISDPLLRLAATAREISRGKSYSLRAPKHGHDEIGAVVVSFN
jgi:methyl-accepting chemotaxis protein